MRHAGYQPTENVDATNPPRGMLDLIRSDPRLRYDVSFTYARRDECEDLETVAAMMRSEMQQQNLRGVVEVLDNRYISVGMIGLSIQTIT